MLFVEVCDVLSFFLLPFQVKPARAGSSIGVKVAYGVHDSLAKAKEIVSEVSWVF